MLFRDKEWLRDQVDSAPAARAAIGMLVARGDWSWWQSRSSGELRSALAEIVPRHGIVTWGGDEAAFRAEEWVDAVLAIDLARSFTELIRLRPDVRLRIGRSVWEWDALEKGHEELSSYLATVVPLGQVFYEWPRDRRPRRLKPERQDGALVVGTTRGGPGRPRNRDPSFITVLNDLSQTRLANWQQDAEASDVLITSSIDLVSAGTHSTNVLIVATDDRRATIAALDDLRVATGAQCIVRVSRDGSDRWLRSFGEQWLGQAIDYAVLAANEATGVQGEVVASNQTFLLESHRFLNARPEDQEGSFGHTSAFAPTPPSVDLLPVEVKPVSRTPPPTARVLEVEVYDDRRRSKALPKSGKIRLLVSIRPKTPLRRTDSIFPDDRVDWSSEIRVLQVHLIELSSNPISHKLVLPRTGTSDVAEFSYNIVGPVDLRFMVCDGAQILQTIRLQGEPGKAFKIFIETDVITIEEKPRSFDLALLVNDSLGGKPSLTTVTDDKVEINILEASDIEKLRNEARDLLRTVVSNPKLSFEAALMDLADVGYRLFKALKKSVKNWPDSFDRVQLMTKVNAIFPFEFIYDRPLPKAGSKICENSAACLTAPLGTSCCSLRESKEVFCPMGFLGLKTIIERHTWDAEQKHPLWFRRSQDFSSRTRLGALDEIVFAASNRADNFKQNDALPLSSRLARTADLKEAFKSQALTWEEWRNAILREKQPPSMAVLVPHVEGKKLVIGKAEQEYLSSVEMGKVSVAIVVGCNTAHGEVDALSLPNSIINDGNVRVVISALTEVLGRHSNTAVLRLGERMRDASTAAQTTTVGEFVTGLRREFLANGMALGLVLVAIGDADVVLGKGEMVRG